MSATLISNFSVSISGEQAEEWRGGQGTVGRGPSNENITAHPRRALVSLDWRASRSNLHQSVSRAAAAKLKGGALVKLVELHSPDPVASHASLRDRDVSKTQKGWAIVQASELKFGPEKWSFIASSYNYSINWFNRWIKAYKLNFFVLYTLSFPQNASFYKYIKISCNAKCNTHY